MDGTEFSAAFDPIEVGNLVAGWRSMTPRLGRLRHCATGCFTKKCQRIRRLRWKPRNAISIGSTRSAIIYLSSMKRTDLPGGVVEHTGFCGQRREPERRVLHVGRVRNLADRGHIG